MAAYTYTRYQTAKPNQATTPRQCLIVWVRMTMVTAPRNSHRPLRHVGAVFFFFSSRRRHTRLQGDWSSDVCSSDLMACDLRFAAEGAKFGIPAARLSIIYGVDAVGQLVDLVGPAYAKDILYSARTVGDREALAMGLIQRLLPPDELEAHAYDYLRKVADNAPLSVRGAKLTIESYLLGLTEERRAKLKELALEVFESEDYREGTRAFLEKRAPKFQGR